VTVNTLPPVATTAVEAAPAAPAAVDTSKVTYAMIEALMLSEVEGQVWRDRLADITDRLATNYKYRDYCRRTADYPAMTRADEKAKKINDAPFVAEMTAYFEKMGVAFEGGTDPTRREWYDNAKTLEPIEAKILAEHTQFRNDIIVYLAQYGSFLDTIDASLG
jgi:hypothetical protein